MGEPTIELVMSEFGSERRNAGGSAFESADRLNPTLETFREQFPHARVTLYTDFEYTAANVDVVIADPPFDRAHPRYGWRAHDYYQAHGLLESSAEIAIAMDSDMMIVSDRFRAIVPLAERFGFAAPANPRLQVLVDARLGIDSSYDLSADPTGGTGFAYNLTPLAFATTSDTARTFLELYCRFMRERPGRAGLRLWQAAYAAGFSPYLLPYQWCVCRPADLDSRHIWSNAIALHVGHSEVYPHYVRARRRERRQAALGHLRGIVRYRLGRLVRR
jgi:hypothetical protein